MGNHSSRNHRRGPAPRPENLTFSGIYPTAPNVDLKAVKRLILSLKLAPMWRGVQQLEVTGNDQWSYEECPICMYFHDKGLNHTVCCRKAICTECFLQLTNLESDKTCPFCNHEGYEIVYTGPLSTEEKNKLMEEDAKVKRAEERVREEERQRDEDRKKGKEVARRIFAAECEDGSCCCDEEVGGESTDNKSEIVQDAAEPGLIQGANNNVDENVNRGGDDDNGEIYEPAAAAQIPAEQGEEGEGRDREDSAREVMRSQVLILHALAQARGINPEDLGEEQLMNLALDISMEQR